MLRRRRHLTALAVLATVVWSAVPAAAAPAAAPGGASLGGTVRAADGTGANGVCVTVVANGGEHRARTAAGGTWRVDGVAAGPAFVSFNDCVDAVPGLAATWWPGTTAAGDRHGIAVTRGSQRLDIDVTLRRAAHLRGRVVDATGSPVTGACIIARHEDVVVGRARTGGDGHYTVSALPAVSVDVEARDCTDPSTLVTADATDVSLTSGSTTGVAELRLQLGGAVEGLVAAAHTGAAVTGACVTLWTAEQEVGASLYRGQALSGLDPLGAARVERGRYVLDGIPPGRYRVFFGFDFCGNEEEDGYAEVWFDGAVPPDERPQDVEVVAGGVVEAVDATLAPVPTLARLCPFPPEAPFRDVEAGDVHADGIACAAAVGVMTGRRDGRFDGAAALTRGQLASSLVRALAAAGSPVADAAPDAFDDDDSSVHEESLDVLAAAGVMHGIGPRRSGAGLPVTRAQLASLLVRSYGVVTGSPLLRGPDRWTDDAGSVHEASLDSLARAGVLVGRSPTTVAPGEQVTRAQAATSLSRLLDRIARDR